SSTHGSASQTAGAQSSTTVATASSTGASGPAASSGATGSGGAASTTSAASTTGTGGTPNMPSMPPLVVSGTTFVDGTGKPVLLRGVGIGEWHNIESYMIAVDTPDVGGMGESKLRSALVQAMGQADADAFFATWEANLVTQDDVANWAKWGVNSIRLPIN